MRQKRLEKLRKVLLEKNVDGFFISNFYNILYLTGFKTLTNDEREAWGLITTNNVYLFTDQRYLNDKTSITGVKLKLINKEKGLAAHLKDIADDEKIKRLGFEGDDLKVNELQKIKDSLPTVELIYLEKLILKIREIKDKDEISNVRMACQIGDQCLKEVVRTIKVGTTEKEIAFKIEFWLKEKNYDLSFYPIVAIDKNSTIPHYDTFNGNAETVKKNSIILIDFGAKYQNYHSDMTRMIFVGKPDAEMTNTYTDLLKAQEKTIEQLSQDNNPVSVDQFCRKLITDNQLPIYPHSTGHGVGLQIHESPKIAFTSTDVLLPDQIITIEPGIYLEDKWGMRIEDTVLIKKGKVEILTKFNKQILQI